MDEWGSMMSRRDVRARGFGEAHLPAGNGGQAGVETSGNLAIRTAVGGHHWGSLQVLKDKE